MCKRLWYMVLLFLPITWVLVYSQPGARRHTVQIVAGGDFGIYHRVAEGFWERLRRDGYVRGQLEDSYHVLQNGGSLELVQVRRPEMLFTLGNAATLAVRQQLQEVPIVFSMVLYSEAQFRKSLSSPGLWVSGVTAEVPLRVQLEQILRVCKDVTSVGTIFSAGEADRINALKPLLQERRIGFQTQLVRKNSDLIRAARALGDIDIFWMIPDPELYKGDWKIVVRWLKDRNVLIWAPSPRFLQGEDGADLAVTIDPVQHGRQAADMAVRYFTGVAERIPVQQPLEGALYVKEGTTVQTREGIQWIR